MREIAAVLTEIARVVKPTGILGVMKFKKIDGPPGPPIHIRLSPTEVADRLGPYGFEKYSIGNLQYSIFSAQGVISSISLTTPKWRNLPSFTI